MAKCKRCVCEWLPAEAAVSCTWWLRHHPGTCIFHSTTWEIRVGAYWWHRPHSCRYVCRFLSTATLAVETCPWRCRMWVWHYSLVHLHVCRHYILLWNTKTSSAILWKVSSGWHENYINYSLNNQNNILCYRRFDFTSEVFIREAIWIRKTENMNRDEGSYQLSHVWGKFLHTDDRHRKSVLMKTSDVKSKRR